MVLYCGDKADTTVMDEWSERFAGIRRWMTVSLALSCTLARVPPSASVNIFHVSGTPNLLY